MFFTLMCVLVSFLLFLSTLMTGAFLAVLFLYVVEQARKEALAPVSRRNKETVS